MKHPVPAANSDEETPPDITPEYIEMLRRRWANRIDNMVRQALEDSLQVEAA
jgi:hypothetical protein